MTIDTDKAERVREITQALIEKMGFEAEVSVRESVCDGTGEFICNISVDGSSNLLIGQHGVNLQALQHLVRLLAKKELQENIIFSLDVNSYWEQKSQALVKEAHQAAEQAVRDHAPVALRPMAGYERKIIHAELAKNDRVTTESAGEGENRKVIVKPATIL